MKETTQKIPNPNNYKIFIVIPYYNESEVIADVLNDIRKCNMGLHIVIVDDGSDLPFQIGAFEYKITCIRHCTNLGQGAALQTGIIYCLDQGADVIITFDADGQHMASDIEAVIKPIINGNTDIVFGYRFHDREEEIPLLRKFAIKSFLFFNSIVTGIQLKDYHNGFRAMNRKAATTIRISQNRMAHATEIIQQTINYKLKWMEVPVRIRYTSYSLKKGQKLIDGLKIITDLIHKK